MKQQEMVIPVIVAAVVAGGLGFFGGMKYQQTKTPAFGQGGRNFAGGNFTGGQGGTRGSGTGGGRFGGNGIRPVSGQILKTDDTSITVKMQDGSSRIVMLSDKTTINKAATATKTDLTVGETVAVFGMENSDGSVTAQTIQLNPMMRNAPQTTPSTTP